MAGQRKKDINWEMTPNSFGNFSYEQAQLAVLMDLRDELKKLNDLLHCSNFVEIPSILRTIKKNTTKRKPSKKKPHLELARDEERHKQQRRSLIFKSKRLAQIATVLRTCEHS